MQAKERNHQYLLTEGSILKKLLLVALPIIGSQIIQMTYNLTDMFWLGRLSSGAVAASGTVGMYLWLSMSFATFGAKGAEIGVAQNLGAGDRPRALDMAQHSLTLSWIIGLIFAACLLIFRSPLVRFLNITDPGVFQDAVAYLSIVAFYVPFNFAAMTIVSIFTGSGDSRTPFYINTLSLAINMVLDPVMIFTFGWGIHGAAVATVLAQVVACVLLICALQWKKDRPFEKFRLFVRLHKEQLLQIFRWSTPIAIEGFFFTLLSMLVTRMVNAFGLDATAATRVGSQAESLSWLLAGGFASALCAYVGQNYGGRKWARIHQGYRLSSIVMVGWGLAVTAFLFFGGRLIFQLFLPDNPVAVEIGARYLRILAACQFFQCIEGLAAGAFRGMGKTMPPSIISFTCNAARVVVAYLLSLTPLGLYGIFWGVSLGAVARGAWMYLWYARYSRTLPRVDEEVSRA